VNRAFALFTSAIYFNFNPKLQTNNGMSHDVDMMFSY